MESALGAVCFGSCVLRLDSMILKVFSNLDDSVISCANSSTALGLGTPKLSSCCVLADCNSDYLVFTPLLVCFLYLILECRAIVWSSAICGLYIYTMPLYSWVTSAEINGNTACSIFVLPFPQSQSNRIGSIKLSFICFAEFFLLFVWFCRCLLFLLAVDCTV